MVALTKMFGSEMIPSVTVKASEFGPTHPLQGHIGPATEVIQVRPVGPHPESWGAAVQLPTWFPPVTQKVHVGLTPSPGGPCTSQVQEQRSSCLLPDLLVVTVQQVHSKL